MNFDDDMERLRRAVGELPEVVETTSYGTPSLKLGKKMLARLREPGIVVLPCGSEDEKHLLIEAAPLTYFTIPHYDGYPLILARMEALSNAELVHRLRLAWDFLATPKMKKAAGH